MNEIDGREPGMGDYNFQAIFSALAEINYPGWVSLEAFDLTRDPVDIAKRAYNHLQNARSALPPQTSSTL